MRNLTLLLVLLAACKPSKKALDKIEADLETGRRTVQEVLIDPATKAVREKRRFRILIRDHAKASRLKLVGKEESGQPLVVTGRVVDTKGKPVPGAQIYVFQTDAAGKYGSNGEDNPRIFGFLVADRDGRYGFETIRPGAYAHAPKTPQHIHYLFRAEGYERARGKGPPSLFFADDPRLTKEHRAEIADDGAYIAKVSKDKQGRQRCTYDIVMRRRAEN